MILKTRKAFTLAELMVCLLLISVLATILLPAIMQNRPNKNKVMFRKAYYIIERVVSELINDDDLYPTNEELNVSGFANTAEVTYAGNTYSGASKFCNLFFEKVNTTTGEARCNMVVLTSSPRLFNNEWRRWKCVPNPSSTSFPYR